MKMLFGEKDADGSDAYHTGAAISLADAKELLRMLGVTIAQHEAKIELATAGQNVKSIRWKKRLDPKPIRAGWHFTVPADNGVVPSSGSTRLVPIQKLQESLTFN